MKFPYNLSYWERESFLSDIDVSIIGSGIVGLSAALYLIEKQPNLKIVILERGPLPIGASTRNAGFACFGSPTELVHDLQHNSSSQVWELVEKRWRGLQQLRKRVGDVAMDYKPWGGYEIFQTTDQHQFIQCQDQLNELNKELERITGVKKAFELKDDWIDRFGFCDIKHIIYSKIEGQIDTGKMMQTLLNHVQEKGIRVLNGLEIKKWITHSNRVHLITAQGWSFSTQKMIIATNAFTKELIPEIALLPARNQVLITKPIRNLKIKGCFHYDQGYYYFRNINNRILLGGGRNLAKEKEQTTEFGTTDLIKNALQNLLTRVILPGQEAEIDYWWSGIIGVGNKKQPIIRKINKQIVLAVRLGGMGLAIGSLVGEEAAMRLMES